MGPRQVVLAPEQVELDLPVAGPTSRMLAYAIDATIIFTIELGVVAVVLLATQWAAPLIDWMTAAVPDDLQAEDVERFLQSSYFFYLIAVMMLVQFVLELVYFTSWETVWSGRSLGKGILRLRVVADSGRPLSLQESLTRNLLRIVDMLPSSYLVGLCAMVLSPAGQRLGDVAAGTVVVRLDRPPAPAALPQLDAATSSFRFDRAQVASLGPLDRELILTTLRRLEQLPPERGAALLERTVQVIRQRIGYGEVGLDEQRGFLLALLREA